MYMKEAVKKIYVQSRLSDKVVCGPTNVEICKKTVVFDGHTQCRT
jgi:hypothetical protein